MSFPLFRVTLNNTIAGPLVIDEPGGWDNAVLKLERNEEYHSLVEFYDQPLLFYGQNGSFNGGYDYIKAIEFSQGPDAQINIRVEVSEDDGVTYGVMYDGLLDITSIKEQDFYKLESGLIRNDFWQKFINRKGIPVDLSSTTDLDGGTRAAISSYTLSMPSQTIRKNHLSHLDLPIIFPEESNTQYLQIDMDIVEIDEIKDKFTLPNTTTTTPTKPTWLFAITEDGSYTFDIRIEASWIYYTTSGVAPLCLINQVQHQEYSSSKVLFYIQFNDDAAIALTDTPTSAVPAARADVFTYTATVSLKVGDIIRIYGNMQATLGTAENIWIYGLTGTGTVKYPDYTFIGVGLPCVVSTSYDNAITISAPSGATTPTYFGITADTTYVDTTAEAFTIGNAAKSILSKYIGQDSVLKSSGYIESQCGGYYAIAKGLNVRGYTLSEKPFSLSFDDFWAGINPVLCLGLGYTTVSGVDKIEIEKRESFYNTTRIVNLDHVNLIERGYDTKKIFKSIEIGYEKWSAESSDGIDDPQTKHIYRTRFKTIGEDTKILSKFIAASLAIEQTRRNTKTLGKDWRLDEDTMMIALKLSDTTHPELSENFSSVTNLNNYTTRYNIRLTPARLLMTWRKFLNGCLNWYATNDDFVFSKGEGNYDMTSTIAASGVCPGDGVSLSEKQDIDGGFGQDFMFIPIEYTFEHPLSFDDYKLIRDNRKNAIGVSRTNTGHVPCFIMSLEYHITHGKAKFTVLLGQSTPIS